MPRPARKNANDSFAKSFSPSLEAVETIQRAEKEALKAGRENVKKWMHAADDLSRKAKECAGICSENANALVASGSAASHHFQHVAREVAQACQHMFSDYAEISNQMLACKTVQEVAALQGKAAQKLCRSYFDAANRLYEVVFDGYAETLEPFSECLVTTSEQMRKMVAM